MFSACKVCSKKLWAQFHDLCVQKRRGLLLSSDTFRKFSPCQIDKKFWAHFLDLCIQKQSCLLWSSDAFWTFSTCKFYKKGSWRNSTICASKNEAVCCEVQTHFGSFRLSSFIKKVLGAFSRFMRPKTKQFAVKFRRILDVLCLQVLQKKLWAQFHDLCVQKRSGLLWSSDAFWKFLPARFTESSGRNSTIFASTNEAVCHEIQTHFASSFRLQDW